MSHARPCNHEFAEGHWEGTTYVRKCTLCGIRREIPPREFLTPPVEVELPSARESDETPGEQQ